LLHNRNNKDQLLEKFKSLPKGMSTTDSSGAYGILEFSGNNVDTLLSRWMSYDLEGSLTIGKVVSTTCGQAPVCIYRNIEGNLLMMVRHSFSHYVAGLLKDSAKRI
jgi:sarcosine oxidase subunit gamma